MQLRKQLPLAVLFLMSLQTSILAGNVLTVEGDRFKLNGRLFDMWGIRVASASQTQDLTGQLIANLDNYKSYGVNTVTVFVQGSSGGFCDPFSPDGKSMDAGHLARIKRIIEACDKRQMIAIIGIFYQRTMANYDSTRKLKSTDAVVEAVRTVTHALRSYDNIIINIANEQNSTKYDGIRGGVSKIYDFRDPQKIIELCRVVHQEDADRLVGGGGYDDDKNIVIGRSEHVDVLLFDSVGPDRDYQSGRHYDHFLAGGVRGKPMVNVEMFGGWTAQFVNSNGEGGYYPQKGKLVHYKEVDDAAVRPGLSVFFHSNAWCQGPSAGQPVRYDLAGDGTDASPGIRWYFEYVKKATRDNKPQITAVGNRPDLSVDSMGNVHIVCARDQVLYYRKWTAKTGSWSPEEDTGLSKSGNKFYANRSDPESPHVAVDHRNIIYVTNGHGEGRRLINGTWHNDGRIVTCGKRHDPELSVDRQNNVYVTAFGFRFNVRTDGRWLGEHVFAPITGTKVGYVETCGADDFAHAVWEEGKTVIAVDETKDKPKPVHILVGSIFPDGAVKGFIKNSSMGNPPLADPSCN